MRSTVYILVAAAALVTLKGFDYVRSERTACRTAYHLGRQAKINGPPESVPFQEPKLGRAWSFGWHAR